MSRFIWYELMAKAPDALASFYRAVLGWEFVLSDHQGNYRMIMCDDGGVQGGVLTIDADMIAAGASARWIPYLSVDDVAVTIAAAVADGARVCVPPVTIPQGTFALLFDPGGALVYIMKPVGEGPSMVFNRTERQRAAWNEYAGHDADVAKAFYARHFGFAYPASMPIGPGRDYWFIDDQGESAGAIFADAAAHGWTTYFRVADAFAAHRTITALGGTPLAPPHQVPGGDWVFACLDPEGARFGIAGGGDQQQQQQQQ